jgi:hypothetical protein
MNFSVFLISRGEMGWLNWRHLEERTNKRRRSPQPRRIMLLNQARYLQLKCPGTLSRMKASSGVPQAHRPHENVQWPRIESPTRRTRFAVKYAKSRETGKSSETEDLNKMMHRKVFYLNIFPNFFFRISSFFGHFLTSFNLEKNDQIFKTFIRISIV